MKILILMSLSLLVACNGAVTGSGSIQPATSSNNFWNSRVDTNNQTVSFDVTNGGMNYYSSTSNLLDSDVFTIPEYVDIDNDSLGTIHSDDYMELQIANKIACKYAKVTNYFQFQGCVTSNTAINWTIRANDSYYMSDVNSQSLVADKGKVVMVLKRNSNCTGSCNFNGHIGFSYDL